MTTLNYKKEEIQNNALNCWVNSDKVGTAQIITGAGKTFLALKALLTFPKYENDTRHLFLAEQLDRKKDLYKDIEKFNKIYKCDILKEYNLQFETYQTARNWHGFKFGLVIADEIHDSMSPANVVFYIDNSYQGLLGLSAKISNISYLVTHNSTVAKFMNGKLAFSKLDLLKEICPIIFTYNISQGQHEGASRKLNIYIFKSHLNTVDKNILAGSKTKPFYQTESASYAYLNRKVNEALNLVPKEGEDLYSFSERQNLAILVAAKKRKDLLHSLPTKQKLCRLLLKYLETKTIVFGNNLSELEKITPNVVSSKNTEEENERIRDKFDFDIIKTIASFKKLKQGANLKDIDNCILHSYYSSEIDFIQRIGRLRENKGKDGNVFIFVTVGTQEEVWLNEMLKNTSDFNIKIMNLDTFITERHYESCNK